MTTLLAQIAPQRSTQYAELARVLAPCELLLAPLGADLRDTSAIELGGQPYLQFELSEEPDEARRLELGMLAMTSAFFTRYDQLGAIKGPFLRPIETGWVPALPREMMMARRYRGKTNELFTHYLCNVARYSSALSHRPWETLRLYDPLAGGGTTLFAGLMLGASVAGVELNARDVETTAAFIRQFTREEAISCREKKERLRGVGQRWHYTLGRERGQTCLLAAGDTLQSQALIAGFRPHLIVADLPYGIQHQGELGSLLTQALPVWEDLLPPSGALVLAWESRRMPRPEMIALVESTSGLTVLNQAPYDRMAHRVDRVIKQRDVLVARPARHQQKD
jgi:hypothetical protein